MSQLPRPVTGRIAVLPLTESLKGAAARVLAAARARWTGPIHRTPDPGEPPRTDVQGRPLEGFVALCDNEAVGFMTMAAGGNITDWAVPEGEQAAPAALQMLAAAEQRAREAGAAEVILFKSCWDPPIEEEMIRAGFRRILEPSATLRVVHFPLLLSAIAAARQTLLAPYAPLGLHLHLVPGPVPDLPGPDLTLRVTATATEVAAATPGAADARVDTRAAALVEFLFGARTADIYFPEHAVITPPERHEAVVGVLSALRVQSPWFSPLGDHR